MIKEQVRIYQAVYKGLPAVIMENRALQVTFVPSLGAKMASLLDKETGREYLWQEAAAVCRRPEYDSPFEDWDMFGFDEMFPTIVECYYEKAPWRGSRLPDHGEVWALPWDWERNGDSLLFWVHGVRLPYRLEKRVSFRDLRIIRSDYQVTNPAAFDFDFIWAAHPLFNISAGTRIILPGEVQSIVNTHATSKRLGRYGRRHPWPTTQALDGSSYDIGCICPNEGRHCEKYYVPDRLTEGWAALYHPLSHEAVAFSFPVEAVPFLGVWVNEGALAGQYNAALEPCTGAFDRVDVAARCAKTATLKAKSSYQWYLNLTLGKVDCFAGVDQDGVLL